MDNITWTDLGLVVLFILATVACVYLIISIRNLNSSIRIIKGLLEENKANIDSTLKDLPVIARNLVELSETAKGELKTVEAAIGSISETVETTAASVNSFKSGAMRKIKMVIDIVDIAKRILPRKR